MASAKTLTKRTTDSIVSTNFYLRMMSAIVRVHEFGKQNKFFMGRSEGMTHRYETNSMITRTLADYEDN